MSSRLDRLLLLLELGSTASIRKSAAEQLGEVQRLYPHELDNLLNKVHAYLMSTQWETRVAASQAVAAIIRNIPSWNPIGCEETASTECTENSPLLRLQDFKLDHLLCQGVQLTTKDHRAFEQPIYSGGIDGVKLAEQKELLNKKLGLHIPVLKNNHEGNNENTNNNDNNNNNNNNNNENQNNVKEEEDDLVDFNDLIPQHSASLPNVENIKDLVENLFMKKESLFNNSNDVIKSDVVNDGTEVNDEDLNNRKRKNNQSLVEPEAKHVKREDENDEWSLGSFSIKLMNDLFDASWEKRHGAALGLKVLVKRHGASAGKRSSMHRMQMYRANNAWLQDLCVRLICVLSLDRLGDYLTDEVIAPVRESCAQVLGVVCLHLDDDVVADVSNALLQLLSKHHGVWEVKHGGLLAIKYLLATRQDLSHKLLQQVLPHIHEGLLDPSDDVRSVAASSLLPVVQQLINLQGAKVGVILDSLWSTLKDLDELSASTNSIMKLISLLVSHPCIHAVWRTTSLGGLLPLLYPFINHTISSVRLASLTTINILLKHTAKNDDAAKQLHSRGGSSSDVGKKETLVGSDDVKVGSNNVTSCGPPSEQTENESEWLKPLLSDLSRLIFQRSLLESEANILTTVQEIWDTLLSRVSEKMLATNTGPFFKHWCCIMMQHENVHYQPDALVNVNINRGNLFRYIGGTSNIVENADEKDELVVRARLTAASLLGKYCYKITTPSAEELRQQTNQQQQSNQQQQNSQQQQPAQQASSSFNKALAAAELGQLMSFFLSSKSYLQRFAASNIVYCWALEANKHNTPCTCPRATIEHMKTCLTDVVYYDELAHSFTHLQSETRAFIAALRSWSIQLPTPFNDSNTLLTLERMEMLMAMVTEEKVRCHLNRNNHMTFCKLRANLEASLTACSLTKTILTNRTQTSIASVMVELGEIKGLSNPIIRPLMSAIKTERNCQLQERAGSTLAKLVMLLSSNVPCPNVKVIKNLANMLTLDQKLKPSADLNSDRQAKYDSILVLKTRHETTNIKTRKPYKKNNNNNNDDRNNSNNNTNNNENDDDNNIKESNNKQDGVDSESKQRDKQEEDEVIQRKGSRHALECIVSAAGPSFSTFIPSLNQLLFDTLCNMSHAASCSYNNSLNMATIINNNANNNKNSSNNNVSSARDNINLSKENSSMLKNTDISDVVKCLQVYNAVLTSFHPSIRKHLISHLPHLLACLSNEHCIIRHLAGRCLSTMACMETQVTMQMVVMDKLINWMRDSLNDYERMGAVEAVSMMIEDLNIRVVPYIVSLVLPLLGCMSDNNQQVRLVATYSFAVLVRLMPLDNDNNKAHDNAKDEVKTKKENAIQSSLDARRSRDRGFLQQLLNPKLIDEFKVPLKLKVQLRQYQQEGVNWLMFLSRYKLHGILCDDMGLGKTLQSLCILISDHYNRDLLAAQTGSRERTPPSIVITPPTLTSHWLFEVEKVTCTEVIKPLHYVGIPAERVRLQKQIGDCNLVLASYDVVRNDIDFLSRIKWNYCILDEGHIIKNNKTKMAKAIKQLKSQHRLVLSGTPIQNNVLELWSLFDFLMPGFLGDEKHFQATFGRPILQSRDSKSSSKEQEAGALALEALHRQVLPFMLRRLKEDVLSDLPPKIIQDYYCDLSPLQAQLYEDFSRLKKDSIQNAVDEEEEEEEDGAAASADDDAKKTGKKTKKREKVSHIFQALQYLRKVCNHPSLVLPPSSSSSSSHDISNATKLLTLKQLLIDCGIGATNNPNNTSESSSSSSSSSLDISTAIVSQHRVILFCQMKVMLDVIERDLFRGHMPSVSYLRLDGSVPASNRHQIAHRFNNDPSIDVLLLSTQVGGLGLNLTGADTVVFYDHDWNPMKDLQAMDRAHRIGQRKVVTVYRLITRGTLEEKIMGLQRFKTHIAQSIINDDNNNIKSMASNQLLDLFCLGNNKNNNNNTSSINSGNSNGNVERKGMKSVLEEVGQLWDCKQYNEEYDLDSFVSSYAK